MPEFYLPPSLDSAWGKEETHTLRGQTFKRTIYTRRRCVNIIPVPMSHAPFIPSRERTTFSQEVPAGTTARTETAVLSRALPLPSPKFCKGSLPIPHNYPPKVKYSSFPKSRYFCTINNLHVRPLSFNRQNYHGKRKTKWTQRKKRI